MDLRIGRIKASPSDLGSDAGLRVFRGKPFPALGELDVFAFAAAGFLADTFVDLRIGRIKAVLRLVTRVMANSGPEGEAHARVYYSVQRGRVP